MTRDLEWEGAVNVRDMGGLVVRGVGLTKRGAVIRAGSLDGLTAAGWEALLEAGVRTIIDLRNADVLNAIAGCAAGGVVVHCRSGRDRTGQIVMLLLALVGVATRDVVADYALGADAAGEDPEIQAFLASRRTTAPDLIADLATAPDLVELLEAGGLDPSVTDRLRTRLCGVD